MLRSTVTLLLLIVFVACGRTDRLTLTTSTEIAASADPAIGQVNIGYDRTELVVTPNNPNTGAVPSVVASLNSNNNPFSPKVEQVFATGQAADAAVGKTVSSSSGVLPVDDDRRVLVFGTSTNIGLNASFETEGLPNAVFGYKRRESATIPLSEEQIMANQTSSVLAAVSINADTQSVNQTGLSVRQFMATGTAAEGLAKTNCVRINFVGEATKATAPLDVRNAPGALQAQNNTLAQRVIACAVRAGTN